MATILEPRVRCRRWGGVRQSAGQRPSEHQTVQLLPDYQIVTGSWTCVRKVFCRTSHSSTTKAGSPLMMLVALTCASAEEEVQQLGVSAHQFFEGVQNEYSRIIFKTTAKRADAHAKNQENSRVCVFALQIRPDGGCRQEARIRSFIVRPHMHSRPFDVEHLGPLICETYETSQPRPGGHTPAEG